MTRATLDLVLLLVADYQRFYGVVPDEDRNRAHLGRFAEGEGGGIQFIARDDVDAPLGFATLYFPYGTLAAGAYCLLNDLYTVPTARGRGVGRALITHCAGYARVRGFGWVAWQTAQSNTTAQRLYDSLPATRTAWYHYALPTDALDE